MLHHAKLCLAYFKSFVPRKDPEVRSTRRIRVTKIAKAFDGTIVRLQCHHGIMHKLITVLYALQLRECGFKVSIYATIRGCM